jgi:hypothetical protein
VTLVVIHPDDGIEALLARRKVKQRIVTDSAFWVDNGPEARLCPGSGFIGRAVHNSYPGLKAVGF